MYIATYAVKRGCALCHGTFRAYSEVFARISLLALPCKKENLYDKTRHTCIINSLDFREVSSCRCRKMLDLSLRRGLCCNLRLIYYQFSIGVINYILMVQQQ